TAIGLCRMLVSAMDSSPRMCRDAGGKEGIRLFESVVIREHFGWPVAVAQKRPAPVHVQISSGQLERADERVRDAIIFLAQRSDSPDRLACHPLDEILARHSHPAAPMVEVMFGERRQSVP